MGNESSKGKGGRNAKRMTLAERRAKELDEKANKKKKTKVGQQTKIQKRDKSRKESDGDGSVKHIPVDIAGKQKQEKKQQKTNKPVDVPSKKPHEKKRIEQTDKQHKLQSTSSADNSSPATPTHSPKKISIKRSRRTIDMRGEDNVTEKSQFRWGTPVLVAGDKGEKPRRGAVVVKCPEADATSLLIEFAGGLREEIAVKRLQISSVLFPTKPQLKELEKTHQLRVVTPARLDRIYNKIKMDDPGVLCQIMRGADPPIRVNEKLWSPYSFNPLSFNHDTIIHCAVRCRSPNVTQWALAQQAKQGLSPPATRIHNRQQLTPKDVWEASVRVDIEKSAQMLQNFLTQQRACYGPLPEAAAELSTKVDALALHLSQPVAGQRGVVALVEQLQPLKTSVMQLCIDPHAEGKTPKVLDAAAEQRLVSLHQKTRFLLGANPDQVRFWNGVFEGL